MPLFAYACHDCGTQFEKLRKFADRESPAACPQCGSETSDLVLTAPGRVGVGGGGEAAPVSTGGGWGGCAGGACGL